MSDNVRMSEADDDQYEEETMHVLVDLGPEVPVETLERLAMENAELSILDLESGEPYIKLDNNIFRGTLDDAITTNLLFEINEHKRETGGGLRPLLSTMRESAQEADERQPRLTTTFAHDTHKMLICQQITLVEKTSSTAPKFTQPVGDSTDADMTAFLDKNP